MKAAVDTLYKPAFKSMAPGSLLARLTNRKWVYPFTSPRSEALFIMIAPTTNNRCRSGSPIIRREWRVSILDRVEGNFSICFPPGLPENILPCGTAVESYKTFKGPLGRCNNYDKKTNAIASTVRRILTITCAINCLRRRPGKISKRLCRGWRNH